MIYSQNNMSMTWTCFIIMSIKQEYLDTLLGYVHGRDMRIHEDCSVSKIVRK